MEIVKVEWRGVKIPYGRLEGSGGRQLERYGLLLWVQADNGLVGVGEASPPGSASEDRIVEIGNLLHDLAPTAIGLSPTIAFDIVSALTPKTTEGETLRFGLETAMLDLQGQQYQRPIEDLLNGVIDWVPMCADISFVEPNEAARQAAQAVADGYRCLKLSIGSRFAEHDVEVVRQVRETIGYDVALRADADESWSPERAIATIAQLEKFNLEYVEQPVAAFDLNGMAMVRAACSTPIAADESANTIEDAQAVIDAGAADVLVIKPTRAGGIRASQAIMDLSAEHSMRSVIVSSMETGVGIAAALHLASSRGKAETSGLASGRLLESDLLIHPLVPVRGHITVPQRPGLGVEVDRDAVDRYTTGVMGVVQ
jgi:L-alanine-DL-glutamate epimerase-like enolase superfamily enzyme